MKKSIMSPPFGLEYLTLTTFSLLRNEGKKEEGGHIQSDRRSQTDPNASTKTRPQKTFFSPRRSSCYIISFSFAYCHLSSSSLRRRHRRLSFITREVFNFKGRKRRRRKVIFFLPNSNQQSCSAELFSKVCQVPDQTIPWHQKLPIIFNEIYICQKKWQYKKYVIRKK